MAIFDYRRADVAGRQRGWFGPGSMGPTSSSPTTNYSPGIGTSSGEEALAELRSLLEFYQLDPAIADQLWTNLVVEFGTPTEAQIDQTIRQTETFKTRYWAIEERRKQGLPAISPTDVLNYERTARSLMRAAGFPPGFYDSSEDFVDLLVKDVSAAELDRRIQRAYVRVAQAPPEVRNQFRQFYGADGESALAAYALDPDRAEPVLMQQVAAAEVGGYAQGFGFGIGRQTAESLAAYGVEGDEARRGFGALADIRPLFTETISEQEDLSAEVEGIESVFGTPGTGAQDVERRRRERAASTGGGGGAAQTRTGYGLGRAE